jgi:hypothetical protein
MPRTSGETLRGLLITALADRAEPISTGELRRILAVHFHVHPLAETLYRSLAILQRRGHVARFDAPGGRARWMLRVDDGDGADHPPVTASAARPVRNSPAAHERAGVSDPGPAGHRDRVRDALAGPVAVEHPRRRDARPADRRRRQSDALHRPDPEPVRGGHVLAELADPGAPSTPIADALAEFFGVRPVYLAAQYQPMDLRYLTRLVSDLKWAELAYDPDVRRLTSPLLDVDESGREQLLGGLR